MFQTHVLAKRCDDRFMRDIQDIKGRHRENESRTLRRVRERKRSAFANLLTFPLLHHQRRAAAEGGSQGSGRKFIARQRERERGRLEKSLQREREDGKIAVFRCSEEEASERGRYRLSVNVSTKRRKGSTNPTRVPSSVVSTITSLEFIGFRL